MRRTDHVSTNEILRNLVEVIAGADYRSADGAPLRKTAAYRQAIVCVYVSDLAPTPTVAPMRNRRSPRPFLRG